MTDYVLHGFLMRNLVPKTDSIRRLKMQFSFTTAKIVLWSVRRVKRENIVDVVYME